MNATSSTAEAHWRQEGTDQEFRSGRQSADWESRRFGAMNYSRTQERIVLPIWLGLVLNGGSSYRQAVFTGLRNVSNKHPEPGAKVF